MKITGTSSPFGAVSFTCPACEHGRDCCGYTVCSPGDEDTHWMRRPTVCSPISHCLGVLPDRGLLSVPQETVRLTDCLTQLILRVSGGRGSGQEQGTESCVHKE